MLSNTDVPTKLFEVQSALYGEHWSGPAEVTRFAELGSDGHWRTRRGWRRAHNPYVVVASGIDLYTMHRKVPWRWRTLDPSVEGHLDLPWAAPVEVSVAHPPAPLAVPNLDALGIGETWCAQDPDFARS